MDHGQSKWIATLEKHRDLPVGKQVSELFALGVTNIYFGNAFASEAELKEAYEVLRALKDEKLEVDQSAIDMFKQILPNIGQRKIMLQFNRVDSDLAEIEELIVFSFDKHVDLGDSNEYMLRSRVTRVFNGKQSIPFRASDKEFFDVGDVLVVNDNLKHCAGKLQIVHSPMRNDGQRNYLES